MTPARLTAFAVLTVLVVSTTSGCSSNDVKKHTATTACAMPSSTLKNVFGTDRFTAPIVEGPALPLNGKTPFSDFRCTVKDNNDNRIIAIAGVAPPEEITGRISRYRAFGGSFDHAGGVGVAGADGGAWACGQVEFDISIQRDLKPRRSDVENLVKALADKVGCWNRTGSDKG